MSGLRSAPPPCALELALYLPGATEPVQRLGLHPIDHLYMLTAAHLENLSLGDFIVLAAFERAKDVFYNFQIEPPASSYPHQPSHCDEAPPVVSPGAD